MYQFPIVPKTLAVVSLLVASVTLAIAQTSNVASIKGTTAESRTMSFSGSVSIEESTRIIAGFLAAEARVREALNQHAFKRDVVLQTIGPNGEVTGEYIRNSQFVFDDHGKRIERVLFHPKSTIHEMRITKEDIQDLAEAQLLGIDIAEVAKYRLTYVGTETVDSIQLHAVDISPSVQPDPNHMKERYFIGRVWLDPKTFQIVKIRGIVEPQGKQRFPMFETWRKPTKDDLAFPARTEADDVLHFQNNDVHYRIKVLYYDYKLFGSQVSITDLDEPADDPSAPVEPKASDPSKEQPNKVNSPKTRRPAKTNAAPNKAPTISVIAPPRSTATCAADRSAPPIGPYHWPYDSEVKVYFVREMFTPEQRLALVDAMSTWTEVGKQNGSGVKFTDAGETERKMSCRGCLTVGRRDVYKQDKHHYAFFYPMQQEQGRLLFSAWIDLDVGITKPTALKGFMVHELAHGLGLWDCTNCRNKQTIMNGFPGINKDNGLVAPSSCDVAAVRDVYNEERQLAAFNARGQEHPTISKADSSLQVSASKSSGQRLNVAEKTGVSHIDFGRRFDGAPGLKPAGALQLQTTPSTSVFKLSPYGTDKRGFSQLHAQLPPDYLRWLTVSR